MTDENKDINKASAGVQEYLTGLDVDIVGIVRIEDIRGSRLEEQALKLLPDTNSIIVLGMELFTEILDLTRPERITGAASANTIMQGQSSYIHGKLTWVANDIARVSRRAGLKALPVPAADYPYDARFLEADISFKDAAIAAGLGQLGYNGLVLVEQFGPRISLSVCLTEAVLDSWGKASERYCRDCNICIAKCPANALDYPAKGEDYSINKYACSTYLTESGGCWECVKQCPVARDDFT
jgi:epoxyqueuosine reductase QueG